VTVPELAIVVTPLGTDVSACIAAERLDAEKARPDAMAVPIGDVLEELDAERGEEATEVFERSLVEPARDEGRSHQRPDLFERFAFRIRAAKTRQSFGPMAETRSATVAPSSSARRIASSASSILPRSEAGTASASPTRRAAERTSGRTEAS
jgi:hypothetical protein